MPLMGACEECEEKRPPHRPRDRVALSRGPDGRRLCSRHARAEWEDWETNDGERRDTDGGAEPDGSV